MKNRHWYVVAHKAGARIFEQEGVAPTLSLIEEIDHPEGTLKNQDIVSDRAGHADPGRNSYEWSTDPKDHVIDLFAKRVAEHLEAKLDEGRFSTLTLIAGPKLLGKIRASLHARVKEKIRKELPKDLAKVKPHNMPEALREVLLEREPLN